MTVRDKLNELELQLRKLEVENLRLRMCCDNLSSRVTQLENNSRFCGCHAQPKNTSAPKKDLKVRIPYDIICD